MTLGQRIRQARGKLTQEEAADQIGVLANTAAASGLLVVVELSRTIGAMR